MQQTALVVQKNLNQKIMKISELQKILEQRKQDYGDLEVRILTETTYSTLVAKIGCVVASTSYNEEEFDYLMNRIGLTEDQAVAYLKPTYLNIITCN